MFCDSFILRARVLKLYRHTLKIAHRAPPQFRVSLIVNPCLKQSIRQEMEKNSECKDKQKIRQRLMRILVKRGINLFSFSSNLVFLICLSLVLN
ncbi:hypothetical protein HID58_030949 [Brassica napus]|uniref:Complex 1 LYR protein domain-containing protein n=1 Tax=Brassica napus TaxID=3708 RepID=A0ABQ8CHJ3_BRANA|nr:hypothetical protein HID58_030949 [Brassica napus]